MWWISIGGPIFTCPGKWRFGNMAEAWVSIPATRAARAPPPGVSDLPVKQILEAALLAAGAPLGMERLQKLFVEEDGRPPEEWAIRAALGELAADYAGRGMELKEVAGGWRIQVRQEYTPWVSRLFEERPARYSRALLETLAIIAYRQPVTRGEIEDIRGVAVSSQIVKTLQEREWIRVVGHRDVPGRPALLATTRQFLDYFGLRSLDELPSLHELKDLDELAAELPFEAPADRVPEPANESRVVTP
jgi:segregation and condensation protein B